MVWVETLFETEIRQVGTSLGILIPGKMAKKNHWKKGKKILVAILEKDFKAIDEAFGCAMDTGPFVRDHDDREFR